MLSNIEELVMGVVWNTKEFLNSQKILQGIIATYQEKPSTNDLTAALCNLEDKAFLALTFPPYLKEGDSCYLPQNVADQSVSGRSQCKLRLCHQPS